MSDDGKPVMPGTAPQPGGGMGGWTRAILIGSLLLNLVLIGAIAGAGFSHREARDIRDRRLGGDTGVALLFEALPPDERRALRRAVMSDLREGGAIRQEVVADTRAMLAAIRSEPFDRSALEPVLERQRQRVTRLFEVGWGQMIDALERMSPAERAAYADALEQAIRRRGPAATRD